MTMFHTRKAMTIGAPGQGAGMGQMSMGGMAQGGNNAVNMKLVNEFKKAQRKDMELGWNLLNIKNSNTQAGKTARVLKIEVAQRLEDSSKLKEAFDDLISRQLSQEELMVVFTAAPFLGEWKQMLKLGKKIEKIAGGMEQLHMMSLQLPIPDFTLVYELCKKHKLQHTKIPNISELTWELYNVKSIKVKFKNVDCGEFESKRKELLTEINKQGNIEWESVPSIEHVHIKRMGSLCQAVSFGEIPMMLNGPWLANKINVKGRTEMPLMPESMQGMQNMMPNGMMPPGMDPSKITILIQEEEWNLIKDNNNNNLYTGTYTLNQRPELPKGKKKTPEHAPVNMTFDCQIELIKTTEDEMYKSKTKNNNNNNNDINDEKSNDNKASNDDEDGMEAEPDEIEPVVTEFDGLELD